MIVQQVAGRRVRNPLDNQLLPTEPVAVTDSPFWRRRIACGDVVRIDDPKKEQRPAATTRKERPQ